MKMKLLPLSLAVSAVLATNVASAALMYIDLGTNDYDSFPFGSDADTRTGDFSEFVMGQILGTSIFDLSDGSIFGAVTETNNKDILNDYGITVEAPTGYTGSSASNGNLYLPIDPAQLDINNLSPIDTPDGNDEGYKLTWELLVEYKFVGTLGPSGPKYTSGYFDVIFNDKNDDNNDRVVFTGEVTGSQAQSTNLDIFFDITYAEDDFLWIQDGQGNFRDAADVIAAGNGLSFPTLKYDTNVNPPVPTADQLVYRAATGGDAPYDNVAIRQMTLDGSASAEIPEPATLALIGMGLLGVGFAGRRRTKQAA